MKAVYRHGDVLILSPQPLPQNATRVTSGIVAEGEATGHAHRLVGGEVWEADGQKWLVASDGAKMTHEEHARGPLNTTRKGEAYSTLIQREYDDEKEWRQVTD